MIILCRSLVYNGLGNKQQLRNLVSTLKAVNFGLFNGIQNVVLHGQDWDEDIDFSLLISLVSTGNIDCFGN